MTSKPYKYLRDDFPPLPVKLNHMDLYINFLDAYVEVSNILWISALRELDKIELDARDLEIIDISWEKPPGGRHETNPKFEYHRDINKLLVMPDGTIRAGETFKLKTVTRCVPSDNILEGIYKDATPDGAPQQFMSQCQQWGFQRIAPVFDDCRAKCSMRTTIEADSALYAPDIQWNYRSGNQSGRAPNTQTRGHLREKLLRTKTTSLWPHIYS